MKRSLHFLAGYLAGITVFLILLPYLMWYLTTIDSWAAKFRDLIPGSLLLLISFITGATGLIFLIWSNLYLFLIGKGGPAEGYNIEISPKTEVLVTKGPYALCRNPMVFGALNLYLSIAVTQASLIALFFLFIFYLLVSRKILAHEEKRLERDFGEHYLRYKCSVPRLIPGFNRKKKGD